MEKLGNDLVGLVLEWIDDPYDRRSFSQVCKLWCKIEGFHRSSLRVFDPQFLHNFIPRFPNLLQFVSSKVISNPQIQFLAQTCPKLQTLDLNFKEKTPNTSDDDDDDVDDEYGSDFNDFGLIEIARFCNNLKKVSLRRRFRIGDVGVVSLVHNLSRNLEILDLGKCNRVTDETLEAIGGASSLQVLDLQGCYLITDLGLKFLASGSLSKTLKKLVLAECDRITDTGVMHLSEICCLLELDLAECGPKVTDTGGVAIAKIGSIKRLNLSWLINVSDATIVALARECKNIQAVDLTGCELITGNGLRAFVNHESLEELVLDCCYNFSGVDVEELVLGCPNLGYLGIDIRMRSWIPASTCDLLRRQCCWIDWM